MRWVIVAIACVLVVVVVVWFFVTRRHPEHASDLGTFADGSPREAQKNDRPSGPSGDIGRLDDPGELSARPERATDPTTPGTDAAEEGRT